MIAKPDYPFHGVRSPRSVKQIVTCFSYSGILLSQFSPFCFPSFRLKKIISSLIKGTNSSSQLLQMFGILNTMMELLIYWPKCKAKSYILRNKIFNKFINLISQSQTASKFKPCKKCMSLYITTKGVNTGSKLNIKGKATRRFK